MNEIQKIIEVNRSKSITELQSNSSLKTKTDFLLLSLFDNIFIIFDGEQEAKKLFNDVMIEVNPQFSLNNYEANSIFKVFKLLQYITLLSEELFVANKTIELLETEISDDNRYILSPIIKNMHEGIINKVLKIYDRTKMKNERNFSLINIQRDYNLSESTFSSRNQARNLLFAHLSLDHDDADQSQFQNYNKLYNELKVEISELLQQIAPHTNEIYTRILLLNDKFEKKALGRLYSHKNYHKLVIHTDKQFEKYYIYDFDKKDNHE